MRTSSCWQDFLMLTLLIIFSASLQLVFLKWKFESSALALILTILGRLSKDLIIDIIGSYLPLAIGKNLVFGMFRVGTTLEKNWLNVWQSSSSLDMVLPSLSSLIFSIFDEFWVNWVNNGRTFLQKLLLSVICLMSRFSK